jgi:5-methylcytosine-specific restriction endonuclease McrA
MNDQILRAHALYVQKKLSPADYDALILGYVAGDSRPRSIVYRLYILSPTWKAKADAAKKRAGYRCQVCNGKKRLEAHHRTYDNLGHEKPEDITVLCHDCHELFSRSQ